MTPACDVVGTTLSTTITTDPSHPPSSSSLLLYCGKGLAGDASWPRAALHETHFNAAGKSRYSPQRLTMRQTLPIGVNQTGSAPSRTRRDAKSGRAVALFNGLGKSFGMSIFAVASLNKVGGEARESFRRPTKALPNSTTRTFQSMGYDSRTPVPTSQSPPTFPHMFGSDPEVFPKIVAAIILNRARARERRISHMARKAMPLPKEYVPSRLSVVFTVESF